MLFERKTESRADCAQLVLWPYESDFQDFAPANRIIVVHD